MRQHALALALIALATAPAAAVVQDSFAFTDVISEGSQGDPRNRFEFPASSAPAPYTIQSIHWDGFAVAAEDPNPDPDVSPYPTWGNELSGRITHDTSGTFADIKLGYGAFWFDIDLAGNSIEPVPHQFEGTRYQTPLTGTVVNPGDTFTLEFYEDGFDNFLGADAIWNTIQFDFDNEVVPTLDPPGANVIRIDGRGIDTYPTMNSDGELQDAASFFGISYGTGNGGGEAPSIVSVTFDTQDVTLGDDNSAVWWESDTENPDSGDNGFFVVGENNGITDEPTFSGVPDDPSDTVDYADEEPDPEFPNDFGELTLLFTPGDFLPGDSIRFGNNLESGINAGDMVDLLISGADLVRYERGLEVRVLLDDGQELTGLLNNLAPGEDLRAFVDLMVEDTGLAADFDNDGDVDGDDFLTWQANFGGPGTPTTGDTDGDGDVDGDDFLQWQAQFGTGVLAGSGAGLEEQLARRGLKGTYAGRKLTLTGLTPAGVPEPMSAALAALAAAVAAMTPRRRT